MRKRVGWGEATTLACLLATGMAWLASAAGQTPASPDERLLWFKTNEERAMRGIAPLALAPDASAVARAYCLAMAERKKRFPKEPVSHADERGRGPGERIAQAGLLVSAFAENIAHHRSASEAHGGFMGSPPHRANILDPVYREMGVGVLTDERGDVFVTEVFVARLPGAGSGGESPAEAFRRVAEEIRRPMPPLLWDAALAAHLMETAKGRSAGSPTVIPVPPFVNRSLAATAMFSGDSLEPPESTAVLLRDSRLTHMAASVRVEKVQGTMAQYRADIVVYRAAQ